jgi:nitroimidazol reductase NimA-like FMN-containing flavoprotein (pyridoxamine 5'-phosphate oxidase superfamily)
MTMDEDEQKASGERAEGYEWEEESDLTAFSEEELRELLKWLAEDERSVSYRRRVIQGRIDLIQAESVRYGGVSFSPEELARILTGGEGPSGEKL